MTLNRTRFVTMETTNCIDLLNNIFINNRTIINKYLLCYLDIDDQIRLIITNNRYYKEFKNYIYNYYFSLNFNIIIPAVKSSTYDLNNYLKNLVFNRYYIDDNNYLVYDNYIRIKNNQLKNLIILSNINSNFKKRINKYLKSVMVKR